MGEKQTGDSSKIVRDALENVYSIVMTQTEKAKEAEESLQKDKIELLLRLKDLDKISQKSAAMEIENKQLRGQLKQSRKQLSHAEKRIEVLTQRVKVERKRVIGWKYVASEMNCSKKHEEIIDQLINLKDMSKLSKQESLFQSPKRPLKDVHIIPLVPMTEEVDCGNPELDEMYMHEEISVGETECHPSGNETGKNSGSESEPNSPSILSNHSTGRNTFQIPQPVSPFIGETKKPQDDFLDTSGILFTSPLMTSTYQISEKINSINSQNELKLTDNSICSPVIFDSEMVLPEQSGSLKRDVKVEDPLESNGFKYVDVVRKKIDRENLNGYTCHECQRYYASDNLTDEQKRKVLKNCSRHRHKTSPAPSTPDEFWSVGFPSTQEYINKGYMGVEKNKNKLSKDRSRKRIKYF